MPSCRRGLGQELTGCRDGREFPEAPHIQTAVRGPEEEMRVEGWRGVTVRHGIGR